MAERDLTFIPKKAMAPTLYQERGPSIISIICFVLLIISGLGAGGAYFYKNKTEKSIEELKKSVERAQLTIDEDVLKDLESMAKRIDDAKMILSQHRSLTPLFDILEESTLEKIRFLNLSYADSGGDINIKMDGEARSYSSLALQSESFAKNKNIKSFVISNITLTEKGDIKFNVDMKVDSSALLYSTKLNRQ